VLKQSINPFKVEKYEENTMNTLSRRHYFYIVVGGYGLLDMKLVKNLCKSNKKLAIIH
jgi:hypothetical protein